MSADARYVAFFSTARGLGAPAGGGIFVRDTVTGGVMLASREDGAGGAPLLGSFGAPSINSDGRRVAFALDPENSDPEQVFVRDLPAGRTFVASRPDGPDAGGPLGDDDSEEPSLSDDGERVAFSSAATNLVAGDTDGLADIYVRDLGAGRTLLMSRPAGSEAKLADSRSSAAAISGDGRRVAFDSSGALDPADSNAARDVYVHDVDGDGLRRVSIAGTATEGNSDSFEASIDRDGTRVSFLSAASSFGVIGGPKLFVRDLTAGTLELASRADGREGAAVDVANRGLISADGRSVAFTSVALGSSPGDRLIRVFKRDLASGVTRLVSRRNGAQGASATNDASLGDVSADGGCVTFATRAPLAPSQSSGELQHRLHAGGRRELRPACPAARRRRRARAAGGVESSGGEAGAVPCGRAQRGDEDLVPARQGVGCDVDVRSSAAGASREGEGEEGQGRSLLHARAQRSALHGRKAGGADLARQGASARRCEQREVLGQARPQGACARSLSPDRDARGRQGSLGDGDGRQGAEAPSQKPLMRRTAPMIVPLASSPDAPSTLQSNTTKGHA